MQRTKRIAVLAYQGCFGAEVFGLADVLRIANHVAAGLRHAGGAPFHVSLIGASRGAIEIAGGTAIVVERLRGPIDLLVVPGFDFGSPAEIEARLRGLRPEVALIRRAFARGASVASVCVGAFLLGEAGLLSGRRVTTGWAFAPLLARLHPTAHVEPNALLIEDGNVTTCAAFSAVADLAMTLVRQHAEPRVAVLTAKLTLIAATRDSQAPYVDSALLPTVGAPFSDGVEAWLLHRLRQPYDLPRLAKAFHVSTRTLLRRFRAGASQSPLEFLQTARIARAKALLESTTLAIGDVMAHVGYGDLSTFRRLFVARVGTSPARYRDTFHRPKGAPEPSSIAAGAARRVARPGGATLPQSLGHQSIDPSVA